MTDTQNAGDQIDDEGKEEKTLAILMLDGGLKIVRGTGTKDLRRKLKDYPSDSLIEVWRGRKLPLKSQVKVTF